MSSIRVSILFLGAVAAYALMGVARAQTPLSTPKSKAESPTPTQVAERYLKDGRRYNRAIALLNERIAKSPDAATYRLIGMVYVARYASIGYARHQAEYYEMARQDWERRRDRRAKAEASRDPNAEDIVVPPRAGTTDNCR